jgi:dihydrolipoamide dehydrogenase
MKSAKAEVVVLGAGPGGYTAAFYGTDKGKAVTLVEQDKRLGGVCLNYGCIPSKALLHATKLIREAEQSKIRGISYGKPQINLEKLKDWKNSILDGLSKGLAAVGKTKRVEVLYGRGHFEDSQTLRVETSEGQKFIQYEKAVIAVSSKPAVPKAFDLGNKRIMTSTEALELEEVPKDLLIVGGGYIGLELGTVYATLGSSVVLVEAMDSLLPGIDPDLVQYVRRYAESHFREVRLKTKVLEMATSGNQIKVTWEFEGKETMDHYDQVLVAVGRVPNCQDLGLENTKVKTDDQGFIQVNDKQQTSDSAIYAIGDVTGGELLAHRASKQARIAIDVMTGEPSTWTDIVVPAVVFTDPEVAWCGLSEAQAASMGIDVEVVKVPWSASGRALTLHRADGLTKLIVEPQTERLLGVGITGCGAGELISEGVLAIELGATAKDMAETIHPHPTLSETLMECAHLYYGQATHISKKRRSNDRFEPVE